MTILEKENNLFKQWKSEDNNWVKDGVVNENEYLKYKQKVLFILKEANGGKDEKWIDGDLRTFLKDGARAYTWNNIVRWQYGIENINNSMSYWNIKVDNKFRKEYLSKTAVINLKKIPGNSSSNTKEIAQFAETDKKNIIKQIDIYKPNIIICCGTGSIVKEKNIIFESIIWKHSSFGVNYFKKDETIIIDYFHPAARKNGATLFWNLIKTIREIK